MQGEADHVDRGVVVDLALLAPGPLVGGGRELALGQTVDPVVLDDIDHVHSTADGVGELAKADGSGVPVARDAQIDQVAIGQVGAGQHRGHAPVHGVEAVRVAQEIGRRLGRAADARQLGDAVGREIELETGLDDRAGDRVMTATCAQRRDRALVVAVGEAQPVLGQVRVVQLRFDDEGHG